MVARLVPGIGDIYWILRKIIDLPIDTIEICGSQPRRGIQIFDIIEHNFKTVRYSEEDNCGKVYHIANPNPTWAEMSHQEVINLSANKWVDSGRRLGEWMPDRPLHDLKFNLGKSFVKKDEIIIYTSARVKVNPKHWDGLWSTEWADFMYCFPQGTKFNIIGAKYDQDLVNEVYEEAKNDYDITLSIDKKLGDVLASIKTAPYFVGRASGLGILAEAIGANVYMQYPNHQVPLIESWTDVDSMESGRYFGTTGSISPIELYEEVNERWAK